MRDQWSKLQKAGTKELHRIRPGGGRGAKNTQDCQVLKNENIALQAQMSSSSRDALQHDRSSSSRQSKREFNPDGPTPSFKDQVCPSPLSQFMHKVLSIIAFAIDCMGSAHLSSPAQAFIMGTDQDQSSGTEQMRQLYSKQTDCSVSYHNDRFSSPRCGA